MAPAVWFDKQGGTSRCFVFSPSRLCSVGESFASSSRWFGHWRRGADLTVIILIIMSSLSFRNWIKKSYLSLWASVMNTQQVRWKMFWFWCEWNTIIIISIKQAADQLFHVFNSFQRRLLKSKDRYTSSSLLSDTFKDHFLCSLPWDRQWQRVLKLPTLHRSDFNNSQK